MLQQICTSYELSKELSEEGVDFKSLFIHCVKGDDKRIVHAGKVVDYYGYGWEIYSAPTASELLSIMPWLITPNNNPPFYLEIFKFPNSYRVQYARNGKAFDFCDVAALQDALAKLALILKKENLLAR